MRHFRLYSLEDFDDRFLFRLSEAHAGGEHEHLSR